MSSEKLTNKSIVTNTVKVAFSTLISKSLGLVREIFMARYFGVGPIADAFFTAFRIPNSLRKIFAEGALSAVFVPTIVQVFKQEGQEAASRLVTLAFFVIQGFLLIACLLLSVGADWVITLVAPGWTTGWPGADGILAPERFLLAVSLFKTLIFFIIFISSSSLIAGALQAVNHFTIPALGQIVMNLLFVIQLWFCSYYNLSVSTLSWLLLFNGLVLLVMHLLLYWKKRYQFLKPTHTTWRHLWHALGRFIPCMIGMGAIEINLFVDQALASYLPEGSVSLLQYTYGFMRIPIGVFVVALGTILLPHFSRVSTYAPRRMSYYLLESTKMVFWITIPAMILMTIFSYKIFYTTLLSNKFTLEHVEQASVLLGLFLTGLFFFALNKIVLNIYYALHETKLPTTITIIGTVINTILNFIGIYVFGLPGIVMATVIAGGVQSILLVWVLNKKMGLKFYPRAFWGFVGRYLLQLSVAGWLLYGLYMLSYNYIVQLPEHLSYMLLWTIGYWIWVGPLCAIVALFVYMTRRIFGVKLHFLD